MSDDEVPEATDGMDGAGALGGLGGLDNDFDEDEMPPALPSGVEKELIIEAPSSKWSKPQQGDEVSVHYVGTLEADGSEFDSSRSRGKPFTFVLGQGQVIKGWDLGVATMKQGEVAKFTLAPEFAYGEEGSPPKIPANATLVFEVELLSWVSRSDLFNDGGVIKADIKAGSGHKKPKHGDEVKVSMKVSAKDGSEIEERSGFEFTLGDGSLGPLSRTIEKALTGMKRKEVAQLICSEDYAYGDEKPNGVIIDLTLEEIYETKDVSFAKDKTMMKKAIREGEGYDTPKDTAKVKLSVESATAGAAPIPAFTPKVMDFIVGNGDVCDALECAVAEMKKGERAILTVTVPALVTEAQLGLAALTTTVVLTLELQELSSAKSSWELNEQEKVDFGTARKEVAAGLFKGGRTRMALGRYTKIIELLGHNDNFKDEDLKTKSKELKKVCELNKAACYLRVLEYVEARKACDTVLKEESRNVKALYRRAQAQNSLLNFQECICDCKLIVEIDSQNKEARALIKLALAGQKAEDKKQKGLFANMCKALGKGPIPEPGKSTTDDQDDGDYPDIDMPQESSSTMSTADNAADSGNSPEFAGSSA